MAQANDAYHTRTYFFVGGEYTRHDTGFFLEHQMQVERLTPAGELNQPYPIIFVHGNGQSGLNWLNKPDGGGGWASWFLHQGYEVYIVDQPHVGRSAWNPQSNGQSFASFPAEVIQQRFTAPAAYNLWPQADLHTQWPGTGMMGDPIFDAYYASTLPSPRMTQEQERAMQTAGVALLNKLGPSILVTHSQGALAGWLWADAHPQYVKALLQLEPKGPPFHETIFSRQLTRPWGLTSIPLTYEPVPASIDDSVLAKVELEDNDGFLYYLQAEPARKLANLANMPILVLTAEASYHAVYDHYLVKFLEQAGCTEVEHFELGKMGIHGNGHLIFLERNSDDIAELLENWISRVVKPI